MRNKWAHKFRMFRSFIYLVYIFLLLRSINFFKKACNVVAKLQRALLITQASVMLTDFFLLRFRLSLLVCYLCSFFVLSLCFSFACKSERDWNEKLIERNGKIESKGKSLRFWVSFALKYIIPIRFNRKWREEKSDKKISYVQYLMGKRKGI